MHEIRTKSILSPRNGINVYRGCTHGCIYCDSRSTCYQMDHAFEDVAVKTNAPALLAEALVRGEALPGREYGLFITYHSLGENTSLFL